MADRPSNQLNLLDFLAFLIRWRKFLIVSVLSVATAVAIISFIVTPKYRSEALIKTSGDAGDSFGSFVSSKFAALSSLVGLGGASGEVPGEIVISVLNSRWMSEKVIERFNLREAYEMRNATIEEIIKVLRSNTVFDLDVIAATILIRVTDRDPKRAKEMADFYIEQLDHRNRELKSTMAGKERSFVETRLNEAKAELSALEDSLAGYQSQTGVLNIEEQVKASIQAVAALEANKLAAKTQLELSRHLFRPGSPEIAYYGMQVASIDSSLRELVNSRAPEDAGFDVMLKLEETPKQGLSYLRLVRDIEIQQLLVAYLIQQYEQSKIQEVRNTPTVVSLDPPAIPTQRIWPRRGLMVGLAAFAALFLGIVAASVIDLFTSASRDTGHPQHPHLLKIKNAFHKV